MKKIIFYYITSMFIALLFVNCQEDSATFGEIYSPTNLQISYDIVGKNASNPYGDGSGLVNFTVSATNAISYKFEFGDGESKSVPSGIYQKRYNLNGVHTYNLTVVATGKGGVSTTKTIQVTVLSNFTDDEAIQFLTGGTSKNWYVSASELGHLGVGPNSNNSEQNYFAYYYMAQPWEKAASGDSSCLYNAVMTFSKVGNSLKYSQNNGGSTFFNKDYQSVAGGSVGYDYCYNYDASGEKNVSLSPSESVIMQNTDHLTQTRGTIMNFSDNGFMAYYVGSNSYEILSITNNRMKVRVIQGNNPALAWYLILTTVQPVQDPITDYTNLIWSDEFNVDGAPDSSKWSYDLGSGGWGNNEVQNYTNSSDNVVVQGGSLKITAKSQSSGGYTSARLKSENKFEFTYGKIEFRAKLPTGGGTWPALWLLGANYDTNTWPNCGEIDVMEHKGNNPNVIYATLHYPGHYGAGGISNNSLFPGVSTGFKVYKVLWTPNSIRFYVDNVLFHTFINNGSVPFNHDFFLIMNVAMGGTFGGTIDTSFSQSSMEVDYVRVYQ
ncbi:family 16 glycosylhydrolase [Flavobacterium aciduliphilum]|uniref:Glycosyl hydrolase family 16 n=1 Tax=Flavobacterium aciduliphilum TaxID=1101402 RepID=A0A328YS51_9FLAO|nr:family 16 glycosylhydrolase [Flavobacterium aciduliphilum]RAR72936.1 glycosyl hydrolase family 16 [Flavobacterium aciduliphilum]